MSDRLARLRKAATRPRRTVAILLDGEVREQIEAVEDELDRLVSADDSDRRLGSKGTAGRVKELEAELARLRESAAESTVYLVLEGMQRTPFRALVAAHPPRTDGDGKMLLADRLAGGVNAERFGAPLIRASIVGHRERPEADAPVLPLDESTLDDEGNITDPGMVDFLLGYVTDGAEVPGFATPRQFDDLQQAAAALATGDDAVPLPRKRSATTTSGAG